MKHSNTIALLIATTISARLCFGTDEAYAGVLTALGVPADQIESLKAVTPETQKDFKPDEIVSKIKTGLETTFLNDPNFLAKVPFDKLPEKARKDVESGQYARFMVEAKEFATKTLGLDLSDLSEQEQKSLKGVLQKTAEKYAGKLQSPEAINKLQADLSKALKDSEAKDQTHAEALKAAVEQATGKSKVLLQKLLTEVALNSLDLKVDADLVSEPIMAKAAELYTITLEDTTIKVYQKDHPTLAVMNAGGTPKTYVEVLDEIVTSKNLKNKKTEDESKEGSGKTEPVKVVVDGEDFKMPAHIQKRIDENKKLETAANK